MMKSKLKMGLNSTILVIIAIVAAVLVNMIASTLEDKLPLKADLTANKAFSLSDETIEVLKKVDTDVNVYYFVTTGNESLYVSQTVDMYKGYNNKIHFEQVDPARDPVFAKNIGTEISENSVIVKSGNRVKSISLSDMYDSTYEQYGITEFKLEQRLTLAIDYVLREGDSKVLFTTGHEEIGFSVLKTALEDENATVSEVDLKTADIPADTSALYIIGPERDFSAEEVEKVQKYLEAGGALNISLDYNASETVVLRQFLSEYWGIVYNDDIILETEQARFASNNPYILIPVYGEHDITSGMMSGNVSILWPNTRSITLVEKPGVTQTSLIMSGTNAVAKPAADAGQYDVSENDKVGQVNLAVAEEYINSAQKTRTKIIATGSSFYLMYLKEASVANGDFVRESLDYLRGEASGISVSPKNVYVQNLTLTQSEITKYTYIYGVLPAFLALAAGLVIWLRRRHK